MKINVKVIHAFSANGTGGNPAGVVFEADGLSTEQKQAIAAKMGFPETAFVSQSTIADFKLDFFTPLKQIPHCGHATVGTFTYLKRTGVITSNQSSKETIDGTRRILYIDKYAFMEQSAPKFQSLEEETERVVQSLGLGTEDLQTSLFPTIVNTGNNFLIVPLKSERALAGIQQDREGLIALSEQYGLIGLYPYALTGGGEVQATTRMFGPFYGIEEEAATGMAAGPLACFLYQTVHDKRDLFLIEQGRFMNPLSPSLLHVHLNVKDGAVQNLFVGGDAYVKEERIIEL